ncbi:hypothetical protein C8A03DRAFT_14949 [Achaetomium macrosporum]|uniref:Rhodopsin domain-containing protein n=1 Tax=Achaetomium macrosporum TaxID=79813 RepID=A0AAN7CC69_9PEZI|nr:hypothetical protein C8A03DRAFT_14949 [Achaetomium macrosporum]
MASSLYSSPPPPRPLSDDKPTLLTSWWITLLCAVIILFRLLGRCVRVERLFREDLYAAAALIPLFMRMGFVHPILVYGTNNVLVDKLAALSDDEIYRRSIASRLVLVSRVLHAAILWLLKVVTLEFFDRLVGQSGKNRYTILLRFMRVSLAVTFVAIVIADLAECQPFTHYWQVVPDLGGRCRQGYAHLITVTVCNVLTDLLLVVFPVPIVFKSRISKGRKAVLISLFCLHIFTVVVAIYRVPKILEENGYQATRTMWASAEILMATFAANALTLGTFMRDTGVKKKKPNRYQPTESSGGRSGLQVSRVTKKSSWQDPDSEGDDEAAMPCAGGSPRTGVPALSDVETTTPVKEGDTDIARMGSVDSLIPRNRSEVLRPDGDAKVLKTTTIEVTVAPAEDSAYSGPGERMNGLVLSPPASGLVRASIRGGAPGAAIPLRDMDPLPTSDAGINGQGGGH